jgi:hypothetical protein
MQELSSVEKFHSGTLSEILSNGHTGGLIMLAELRLQP